MTIKFSRHGRRDFNIVCAAIRNAQEFATVEQARQSIAAKLVNLFAKDNSDFDPGRFLRQCGLTSKPAKPEDGA